MIRLWTVGVVLLVSVGCTDITGGQAQQDSAPQLPRQDLLSAPMSQAPVPGWTITAESLGLPPDAVMRPVGDVGDEGIFQAVAGDSWWLFGLNVATGEKTFDPIRLGSLGGSVDFDCFLSAPPSVLCVRQPPNLSLPSSASVVDTSTGAVTFDGPTPLRIAAGEYQPRLEQIGDYVIATVSGEGVHGVGSRAELTWFVPGDGTLPTQFTEPDRGSPVSTLAVQGSGEAASVVFSVVDGAVIEPDLPDGAEMKRAVVYPGGFGYEYHPAGDVTKDRVAFFDDTGAKLSTPDTDGTLESGSVDLPMVRTKTSRVVFTLDGLQLLDLGPALPAAEARLIGSKFYVSASSDGRNWQQYDLASGAAGQTCEGDALGYQFIGSDGEVAVASAPDVLAQGVDLSTCEVLWSLPGSEVNVAKDLWSVNTTLVQRTNDRLSSLVAPA